jgi:N-acyl-D-aspartate/D-glutamate deacylase
MFKWPVADRIARFMDPEFRAQMAADAATVPAQSNMYVIANLGRYTVVAVKAEAAKKYEGRHVDDIAAEEGKSVIDVMLDIAIADDLMTTFAPYIGGYDQKAWDLRGKLWLDDRTLIGASDAGAHLDMIDTFAFSTTVLQKGVREHRVIGLEQAVHQMSGRPAAFFGLVDRGTIAISNHADLVIFDADTVARGPTYYRYDVPGDEFRIYADAIGVGHVFVNGTCIVKEGSHTGALPGTVLKSGRDTRTVPLDAMRDGRLAA